LDTTDLLVITVLLDLPEVWVILDQLAITDHKATGEAQDTTDQLVILEVLGIMDHRVIMVALAILDQ